MQRIGASYIAKRIADQVLAPPPKPAAPDEPEDEPSEEPVVDELDGQPFHDEDGQPLGTALRLPGIAVYVVADGYANRHAELLRSLAEPESRLFWHTEDGRITALIYVPDPANAPRRAEGIRADEV